MGNPNIPRQTGEVSPESRALKIARELLDLIVYLLESGPELDPDYKKALRARRDNLWEELGILPDDFDSKVFIISLLEQVESAQITQEEALAHLHEADPETEQLLWDTFGNYGSDN